tara:strand:+ start:3974 stop:4753 length:780 start_codon:yes stop_codon:yes gene_type:complete
MPKEIGGLGFPFVFRQPTFVDEQILRRSIKNVSVFFCQSLNHELLDPVYWPTAVPPELKNLFINDNFDIHSLAFGCAKGKFVLSLAVGSKLLYDVFVAVIGQGLMLPFIQSAPALEASCTMHVRDERNLGGELQNTIARYPFTWLGSGDAACVSLRQKALNPFLEIPINVDGKYGDETIAAEVRVARQLGVEGSDLNALYRAIATQLAEPRIVRKIPTIKEAFDWDLLHRKTESSFIPMIPSHAKPTALLPPPKKPLIN